MVDTKKVRDWLEQVYELELEIKILKAERAELESEIDIIRDTKITNAPDPEKLGGVANEIKKPTEERAIAAACSKEGEKLHDVIKQIRIKEIAIENIRYETKRIYYELKDEAVKKNRMKAAWYQAVCFYYFEHMSLGEISLKTRYEIPTVKTHKSNGIKALAKVLTPEIIS